MSEDKKPNPLLRFWDKFYKTPKEYTKPFKRRGGFEGIAIKPMYSIQQMTEAFGPCGIGWGYEKPDYTVHAFPDGTTAIYSTVTLWYKDADQKSEPIYGVGGDFIATKSDYGLRIDDEAYKKAFTDALMNAMKHIGMGGEIHMGQFDGNKYTDDKKESTNDHGKNEKPKENPNIMPQGLFEEHHAALTGSSSMSELEAAFKYAVDAARSYKDRNALNELTIIKDKRKTELERT